jgi:hypothetical protein
MHHYIVTRFSVLDGKANINPYFGVKTRKNSNMAKFLFTSKRMEEKFHIFDAITVPSIKEQTDTNFTWLIYSSTSLPEEYKKRLLEYKDSNIHIKFVKNFGEMYSDMRKQLKGKKNYSTTRLDDDDGLSPHFLETLNKYESNENHIISFPHGKKIKRVKNAYVTKGEVNYKKIATGLSAIDMNIFSMGNHLEVNGKNPIIYDSLKDAYSVFCAPFAKNTRRKC